MMNASLKQDLDDLGLAEESAPTLEQWRRFLERVALTYTRADASGGPSDPSSEKRPDEVASLLRDLREKSMAVLQKNAAALAESLALANAVQDSVADAIMVVGAGGRLLAMNQRFREMCKLPEELASSERADVILEHLKTMVKDPEQLRTMVKTSVDKPEVVYTNEIDLKDGRTFGRYVAPVPTKHGGLYGRVICYRDVTEQRRADRESAATATRMTAVKEMVTQMEAALRASGLSSAEGQKGNDVLGQLVRRLATLTASDGST